MKERIVIPNGWRKLRHGDKTKEGDLFFSGILKEFIPTKYPGLIVGEHTHAYIRFKRKPLFIRRKKGTK